MAKLELFWEKSFSWEFCAKKANCAHWLAAYIHARTGEKIFPDRWQRKAAAMGVAGAIQDTLARYPVADLETCDFGLFKGAIFINVPELRLVAFLSKTGRGVDYEPHSALTSKVYGWCFS